MARSIARTTAPRVALAGIFALFAAGYFLSYSFRSIGPLIAPDLMRELSLNAADLGLLASVYFLTFALAQPFIGIGMDRYGPARVNAVLFVFAAAGALVFAFGHSFAGLGLGRALIGLGVSGALMAGMTAFVVWFPQQHRESLTIALSAVGGLAAMIVSIPAELAMRVIGWRGLVLTLGAASLAVAILLWWRIGAGPAKAGAGAMATGSPEAAGAPSGDAMQTGSQSQSQTVSVEYPEARGFGDIFASRLFRAYVPLALFGSGGYSAVQSLWAGPWLVEVEGHTRAGAAHVLFIYALALFTSYLAVAWLSARLRTIPGAARRLYAGALGFVFCAFGLIVLNPWPQSSVPWFLYGIATGAIMLAYPVLTRAFPAAIAGRVVTAYNVVMFVGAFLIQWGIGLLIQRLIDGGSAKAQAYQISFGVLCTAQLASLLWFWFGTRACALNQHAPAAAQAVNPPSRPTA